EHLAEVGVVAQLLQAPPVALALGLGEPITQQLGVDRGTLHGGSSWGSAGASSSPLPRGERGWGGGGILPGAGGAVDARLVDRLQDAVEVAEHICIPGPEHAEPALSEELLPSLVRPLVAQVALAVQLDDEGASSAVEVRDVRPDDVLPPKAVAREASPPQVLP